MTPRQRKFCDEYLISGNATDAAIKAGYSPKTAKQTGSENLAKPDLKAYIETISIHAPREGGDNGDHRLFQLSFKEGFVEL